MHDSCPPLNSRLDSSLDARARPRSVNEFVTWEITSDHGHLHRQPCRFYISALACDEETLARHDIRHAVRLVAVKHVTSGAEMRLYRIAMTLDPDEVKQTRKSGAPTVANQYRALG